MQQDSYFTTAKNTIKSWFGLGKESRIQAEKLARVSAANVALSYYSGDAPPQLRARSGQPDDNIYVNYAETIVDKGVDFLFGKELKISVGSDADSRGEEYLEKIWKLRSRSIDLIDGATDGAIFGDCWFKIRIRSDGLPEVFPLDPQNMSVVTSPTNFREIQKYICAFETFDERGEKIGFKEETSLEDDRWIIREFTAAPNSKIWRQQGEDVFWDYEFAPVFHCKNLPKSQSFYGKPDLTKSVLSLVKYIARLDSLIGKIVRVHSSPKPYATGLERQDLQIGTDEMLFLPDVAQKIGLLEMTGDLAGAIMFRRQLRESLAEVSKCPEIATGKVENVGQLSGFALQILYSPLVGQTEKKQLLYGGLIESVVAALLEIGGFKELASEIKLHWISPVPVDPKEESANSLTRLSVGFSQDTEIRRLGGEPEREREMKKLDANLLADAIGGAFNSGKEAAEIYT